MTYASVSHLCLMSLILLRIALAIFAGLNHSEDEGLISIFFEDIYNLTSVFCCHWFFYIRLIIMFITFCITLLFIFLFAWTVIGFLLQYEVFTHGVNDEHCNHVMLTWLILQLLVHCPSFCACGWVVSFAFAWNCSSEGS